MKNKNNYYEGFNGSSKRIDYLKYGMLNEFGFNLDSSTKKEYDEESIIKTTCNHNNSKT